MPGTLHLIKLCVGVAHPDELIAWQAQRRRETGRDHAMHVTRMWPRRAEELLDGGSLYWVMKGVVRARQRILALEEMRGADGILRCAVILHPDVVNTEPLPRRAFQGWRYLPNESAPADVTRAKGSEVSLPDELALALSELGVR